MKKQNLLPETIEPYVCSFLKKYNANIIDRLISENVSMKRLERQYPAGQHCRVEYPRSVRNMSMWPMAPSLSLSKAVSSHANSLVFHEHRARDHIL